jgi:hypothetical protein
MSSTVGALGTDNLGMYIAFGFKTVGQVRDLNFTILAPVVMVLSVIAYIIAIVAITKRWVDKLALYQWSTFIGLVVAIAMAFCIVPSIIAYSSPVSDGVYHGALYVLIALVLIGAPVGVVYSFTQNLLVRDLIKFDNFVFDLDRENMFQVAFYEPSSVIKKTLATLGTGIFLATGLRADDSDDGGDPDIEDVVSWNVGTNVQMLAYGTIVVGFFGFTGWYMLSEYPLSSALVEQMSKCVEARNEVKAKANGSRAPIRSSAVSNPVVDNVMKEEEEEEEEDGDEKNDENALAKHALARKLRNQELEDWHYLSDNEIKHVVSTFRASGSGRKAGLVDVMRMPRVGAILTGPFTLVIILISIGFQYSYEDDPPFALLSISLFQGVSLYVLCYTIVLPSFLVCDALCLCLCLCLCLSLSLSRSITACLPSLTLYDMTSNHHPPLIQ